MSGFARRYPFRGSKNVAGTNVWRISALILKSDCFALDYPIIRSIKLPLNCHVSRIIRNFNVRPQFFPTFFQSSVKSEYRISSSFPSRWKWNIVRFIRMVVHNPLILHILPWLYRIEGKKGEKEDGKKASEGKTFKTFFSIRLFVQILIQLQMSVSRWNEHLTDSFALYIRRFIRYTFHTSYF